MQFCPRGSHKTFAASAALPAAGLQSRCYPISAESCTVHDFKFCSCGSCAVDGGHEYLRRCGNPEDWEELSETQSVDD
ncbi:DUF7695 domain-containing protein [Faecalibacterium prausnitzii]|uniref:DUF7695 domain-containing protein n=1 Tax=Faecalibacterium TaxID=216851 RepID=UPI003D6D36B2